MPDMKLVASHRAPPGPPPGGPRTALPRHGARRIVPHGADSALAGAIDAQTVIYRLEEAGRALLALPETGYSSRLRLNTVQFIRAALEGNGCDSVRGEAGRLRPTAPDSEQISRMDEALGWIPLIPRETYVLRRVVGCRALVSPATERHLFPWRRIGVLLGADHKAVQRWHAQGIDIIVAALNAGRGNPPSSG